MKREKCPTCGSIHYSASKEAKCYNCGWEPKEKEKEEVEIEEGE